MCNCNDLLTIPSISAAVTNGVDGVSAYVYAISADSADNGTTFTNHTYPADATQDWRAFYSTNTALSSPLGDLTLYNGLWFKAIGTDGANGADADAGGVSFEYKWLGAPIIGWPGNGYVMVNTPTVTPSTTVLSIANTDSDGNNVYATIAAMLTTTSTILGTIKITKATDSSKFASFSVTSFTQNGTGTTGWMQLGLTYLSSNNTTPFTTGADLILGFSTTGDKGTTGTTGAIGSRTSYPTVYQWAASAPAAPSGTSTYTWATGATTLPSTPGSWTVAVGTPTSALYKLYTATQAFNDSLTSATSTITWSSVVVAQRNAVGPGYTATSTSSNAIVNTGAVTFTTQPNLAYTVGARVRATETASNLYMEGVVTSYSGTTMIFTADKCKNDTPVVGPFTVWNINLTGAVGASGSSGIVISNTGTVPAAGGILTLFSNPLPFITAPGAGYYIELLAVGASLITYNAPAFSNTHIIDFIGFTSGVVYASIAAAILAETAVCTYSGVVTQNTVSTKIRANEAIYIKARVSDPTLGQSDMCFTATYLIKFIQQ